MSVIRILYVEDDLNFGRMTKVFLDQAGFLVELTTNVEEAWKLFHTRRPDLLLVDLDLEGSKNGIDLIRQIITEVKQYPVIVYSSHTDPATVITTIELGVMDHIGKDTDREVFLAKLRNIAKRNYSQTGENPRYKLSAITTYNQRNGVLTIGNKSHKVKGKDMRLLQLLCLHFNEWVSPKELSFGLWGMEKNIGELKRYIGHLRQELSEDPALSIENKHGGYYKLQGE